MTGRLAPQYDYFKCVVNIPEDHQRVDEPSEIDGEQVKLLIMMIYDFNKLMKFILKMSVMAGAMNRMYGAATMVGKDERNGRINPALEADDDLPAMEAQRQMQKIAVNQAAASIASNVPGGQGSTAF
jgi:solute carrier family 5 (high affinity choline transporter), member 7